MSSRPFIVNATLRACQVFKTSHDVAIFASELNEESHDQKGEMSEGRKIACDLIVNLSDRMSQTNFDTMSQDEII